MHLFCPIKCAVCTSAVLLLLTGCREGSHLPEAESCLEFLYENMDEDDDMLHPLSWWENCVHKTLQIREQMGWDIPEREFRHFVLPPRACNEKLDDFRITYADTLCRRVAGMSMEEAAVQMNCWCAEQAAFGGDRADSPMGTVQLGSGTCNELSELLVCALRTVGIPARVVSAVWTVKSGSHSWVEAWIDGQWCYMGGAEPAPKVNFAWFYEDATSIMLAPIQVFGDYEGPEPVLGRIYGHTIISNLARYTPVKYLTTLIEDNFGNPLPDVHAEFYVGEKRGREKYSILNVCSDDDGIVKLQTGLGECAVVACRDSLWGVVKAGVRDTSVNLVLCMSLDEAASALENMELAAPAASIVPGTPEGSESWVNGTPIWNAADSVRAARHRKAGDGG